MTYRLPDFIIAGAPRSGTTWLASCLDLHPDLWMAKPLRPEPKFFLVDETYAAGLEDYSRRWFSDAPAGVRVGEKSTNYMESRIAAERMAVHLPAVRLVFLLRDPVERALSNYRWSVSNGMEDLDLAAALAREAEREANLDDRRRYSRPHAYVSRGRYAELLTPWFDHFTREQIAVVRFEDLIQDSHATVAGIHRHLGVKPRPDLVADLSQMNAAPLARHVDGSVLDSLQTLYSPLNDDLAALLGPGFQPWEYEVSDV